ncbi:MAG: acyl-CoA dehydrogenase family protein [Rhodobacter sp.]|nr:acyl-CoA dehydrogenase family protein [Paracoccaceae bacterium]MCC0075737.1 acyl-CoA dehydrogenase family protein [Rhodobacter sp.]
MIHDVLPRPLFTDEHTLYRDMVRRFVEAEIVPHHAQWDDDGVVPRALWSKAGETGLLCPTVAEEWGGPGADFLYSAIVIEEMGRVWANGPGFIIHSEMAAPYIETHGTDTQKAAWLPKLVSGEAVVGVAMSEPAAGSDLRGMKTRARQTDDGWVLTGQKVFISNGQLADVFIVAAKTSEGTGVDSVSLFIVEADRPGFRRGKNLAKIGAKAQDTSELFFDGVEIPHGNLLGTAPGKGFSQLMHGLARERLTIAISCIAKAEGALDMTLAYVADRELFGKKLADFQNTQFKLAEVRAEITVGRAMVDQMLALHLQGRLDANAAAAAKLWTTEMLGRTVDTCLQLFGGWGYMWEYPIARAYADARVERIAGGGSEVMKSIIAKAMFREQGIKATF